MSDTRADTAAEWRARAEVAEARVAELAAERARLWEEVHRLRAERRQVEHYQAVAEKVTGSLSWRLTKPLRSGKALARRLREERERRARARRRSG